MTRQELDKIQELFINSDTEKWQQVPSCGGNMFSYYGDDGTHLHITIMGDNVALKANDYLCFLPFDVLIIWGYDALVDDVQNIVEYVKEHTMTFSKSLENYNI